jgi:hypothetical protein
VLVSVEMVNGYNVLCSVNRVLDVSSVLKVLPRHRLGDEVPAGSKASTPSQK